MVADRPFPGPATAGCQLARARIVPEGVPQGIAQDIEHRAGSQDELAQTMHVGNLRRLTRDATAGTVPHMDAHGSQTRAALPEQDAATAFGAILEALSNVISPALIDRAGWVRLRDMVGALPVDPGTGFGFELRLAEPTAGADFYAVLLPGCALAQHYIRRGPLAAPGSLAAALAERLATIDVGAPWTELLGVEYDLRSGVPGAPPGLFARLRSDWTQSGACGTASAGTVAAWLAGAVGWRLADGEREALGRAFDGLAASGGMVADVGIMPGRPGRTFKITSPHVSPIPHFEA